MTHIRLICSLIFFISFGAIFYSYALYAILIRFCAKVFGRAPTPPANPSFPRVTLLISAFNEAEVIEQRILNALQTDYPSDRFEIVIASDGSTDATAEIVRRYESRGVRLIDYPVNRGKATALNVTIPLLNCDVVALSDANSFFDVPAIANLARWFTDDRVTCVSGKLVLTDPANGRNADSLYWKYETYLKVQESRLGALLGSNGAIYAMRKDRYVPIPERTTNDDFLIPLLSRLKHGGEIIFDAEAIAREQTTPDMDGEFFRRVRIGAGGFQAIVKLWPLLNPMRGWISLTFFSHKILRWICPLLMIAMIVSDFALIWVPMFRAIAIAQIVFYSMSAIAGHLPAGWKLGKPARLAAMFVSMNAALMLGMLRWATRRQRGHWTHATRSADASLVAKVKVTDIDEKPAPLEAI